MVKADKCEKAKDLGGIIPSTMPVGIPFWIHRGNFLRKDLV